MDDLIFNVQSDDEDENNAIIITADFRILDNAVDGREEEGGRNGAHDADRVPERHQLSGRRRWQPDHFAGSVPF